MKITPTDFDKAVGEVVNTLIAMDDAEFRALLDSHTNDDIVNIMLQTGALEIVDSDEWQVWEEEPIRNSAGVDNGRIGGEWVHFRTKRERLELKPETEACKILPSGDQSLANVADEYLYSVAA
jgi:hypothetical protein